MESNRRLGFCSNLKAKSSFSIYQKKLLRNPVSSGLIVHQGPSFQLTLLHKHRGVRRRGFTFTPARLSTDTSEAEALS